MHYVRTLYDKYFLTYDGFSLFLTGRFSATQAISMHVSQSKSTKCEISEIELDIEFDLDIDHDNEMEFDYDIELDTECHIEIKLDTGNSSSLSFNCLPQHQLQKVLQQLQHIQHYDWYSTAEGIQRNYRKGGKQLGQDHQRCYVH